MSDFQGRIALVTGASRGIGAAIAEKLAAKGAHVVLTARTAADLEAVEQRIFEAGGSATIAPMDLTEGGSIERLAAALRERWGKIDILVLNAAMLGTLSPVPVIDPAEFNRVLTLNLLAQQALIASFDSLLRGSNAGRLVILTSSVGSAPRAFWGAYGASKAALETLALSYAEEVKNLALTQGCDCRSGSHPHRDARQGLSRRRPGYAEGTIGSGEGNRQIAQQRLSNRPSIADRRLIAGDYSLQRPLPHSAI
jgi:NAD(P)-dependent dehydrogenase (short-subunit alcohol dehydrogenase family)